MGNESLIRHLRDKVEALRTPRVEAAFRAAPRAYFVPEELADDAYEDYPLPIGFGQTISQPTTVAFMLEKLDIRPGQKVLDIGAGSGWTAALLALLVGAKGKVIGLEIIPELTALGKRHLARWYSDLSDEIKATAAKAEIRQAKSAVIGLPEEAPFDRILVSAAAEKVPEALVQQLRPGGALLIPIGRQFELQKICLIRKNRTGEIQTEEYPGFMFVPLR